MSGRSEGVCRPVPSEPPRYLANPGDCGARGVEEVGLAPKKREKTRTSARAAEEAREALKKRTLPTYWRRLEAAEGDSFVLSPEISTGRALARRPITAY